MCLILFSYKQNPDYPFIFAANRDEFYDRPSAPVALWEEHPDVLGGRDLKEGGTWLGVTRKGRMAALTNYRDPLHLKPNAPSRGWLVRDFLTGETDASAYVESLKKKGAEYNGFNMILGCWPRLFYCSNMDGARELEPGLYGLSNHLLDTPWPKVERGKKKLATLLKDNEKPSAERIFTMLADMHHPEDSRLPDTGIGLEWERILSSMFITCPVYGTRSSSVIIIDRAGHVTFTERAFNGHADHWMSAAFEFGIPA